MESKEASYRRDSLPPLTDAQRQDLERLATMPDDQVNHDDVPKLKKAQLAEFKPSDHYRPVKRQITARVDADVLAWLRAGGKGYQSRMNAILRKAMLDASRS